MEADRTTKEEADPRTKEEYGHECLLPEQEKPIKKADCPKADRSLKQALSLEMRIELNAEEPVRKHVGASQLVPVPKSVTKADDSRSKPNTSTKQTTSAASMQIEKYHQQWFVQWL
jgi:hypothetical protein